jgi:hypothetical protein
MRDRVRLAVLTGVALLVAACGGGPVENIIDEEPALAPLVQERALWDATSAPAISTVGEASLIGGTAVISGDARDDFRLAVVDAATGMPRWSFGYVDPLPGGGGAGYFRPGNTEPGFLAAGTPEDFLVFVPYYRRDCEHPTGLCPREDGEPYRAEEGVAAMSGKDGSVRWMAPVVPFGEAGDTAIALRDVGENLLLVETRDMNATPGSLHTVALRLSDGQELWRQPGVEGRISTAGTVMVRRPTDLAEALRLGHPFADGTVVALDAASGHRRWDLHERFSNSEVELVAGDLVVVRASRDGADSTRILEAASGREVAHLGNPLPCRSDARSLIACIDPLDHTLSTFRIDDREIRVSRREVRPSSISAVWRGRVFLSDAFEVEDPARRGVVDRSGNVLADRLPGHLLAISDRYAVFRTTDDGNISVHAVTP